MESESEVFQIFDHNENDKFCIYGLENLIEWLNENDDNFSFSLSKSESGDL